MLLNKDLELELITISFKKYVFKRVIQNLVENIPFSWVLSLLSCVCVLSSLNAPWAYHLWIRRNINYIYYYYYWIELNWRWWILIMAEADVPSKLLLIWEYGSKPSRYSQQKYIYYWPSDESHGALSRTISYSNEIPSMPWIPLWQCRVTQVTEPKWLILVRLGITFLRRSYLIHWYHLLHPHNAGSMPFHFFMGHPVYQSYLE